MFVQSNKLRVCEAAATSKMMLLCSAVNQGMFLQYGWAKGDVYKRCRCRGAVNGNEVRRGEAYLLAGYCCWLLKIGDRFL